MEQSQHFKSNLLQLTLLLAILVHTPRTQWTSRINSLYQRLSNYGLWIIKSWCVRVCSYATEVLPLTPIGPGSNPKYIYMGQTVCWSSKHMTWSRKWTFLDGNLTTAIAYMEIKRKSRGGVIVQSWPAFPKGSLMAHLPCSPGHLSLQNLDRVTKTLVGVLHW